MLLSFAEYIPPTKRDGMSSISGQKCSFHVVIKTSTSSTGAVNNFKPYMYMGIWSRQLCQGSFDCHTRHYTALPWPVPVQPLIIYAFRSLCTKVSQLQDSLECSTRSNKSFLSRARLQWIKATCGHPTRLEPSDNSGDNHVGLHWAATFSDPTMLLGGGTVLGYAIALSYKLPSKDICNTYDIKKGFAGQLDPSWRDQKSRAWRPKMFSTPSARTRLVK